MMTISEAFDQIDWSGFACYGGYIRRYQPKSWTNAACPLQVLTGTSFSYVHHAEQLGLTPWAIREIMGAADGKAWAADLRADMERRIQAAKVAAAVPEPEPERELVGV